MEKMILSTHHHPSSIIHLMAVNTFSDYEDGAPLYLTQGELAIRVPFASVDLSSHQLQESKAHSMVNKSPIFQQTETTI